MNTGIKIALGIVATLVLLIVLTVGFVISAKFTAEGFEGSLIYSDKNKQNIYSNTDKILSASGLTVKNFGETKINAIKEGIKRYSNKPNAMMLWIKENPQQIDSKVWEKFMSQVEKYNQAFANEQTSHLAKAEAYRAFIKTSIKGTVASAVFGYPTAETQKIMDLVIQTKDTQNTWKTGTDTPKNYLK